VRPFPCFEITDVSKGFEHVQLDLDCCRCSRCLVPVSHAVGIGLIATTMITGAGCANHTLPRIRPFIHACYAPISTNTQQALTWTFQIGSIAGYSPDGFRRRRSHGTRFTVAHVLRGKMVTLGCCADLEKKENQ
jgi:hypothetical protein